VFISCRGYGLTPGVISVFRYFCSARGRKVEENNIRYGTLARAVREGGLLIAIIARYSTIPGHGELSSTFPT
jgi:hypothetical protein